MVINLKILTQAIKEHTRTPVLFQNENQILIGGMPFHFSGDLIRSPRLSGRFSNLKSFLVELKVDGTLPMSEDTLGHVLNRYRHLLNNKHQ